MNTECPNDDHGRAIKECYNRLREPRKKEAIANNRADRVWGFIEELEEKDKEKREKDAQAAELLRNRPSRITRSNVPKPSRYFKHQLVDDDPHEGSSNHKKQKK